MKQICFFVCINLVFIFSYSQTNTKYVFNVELSHWSQSPSFVKDLNGFLKYDGSDLSENSFFSNYSILSFYQTYPSSKVLSSLNMFTFETTDKSLMYDLVNEFPVKYLRIEDLTGHNIELLYYPNDYGTGTYNPVANLGAEISLKSFSYINAPKAWDYTLGNVVIGISDGKVDDTDIDFNGKTEYLHVNNFSAGFSCGSEVWHGVSVGAIAAAQGNNSHGMTGVCSDCGILNVPYTLSYNGLLDLANSGVKVINMSWTYMYQDDETYMTGYIPSQQSIIDELHNMGVVLVAAAGNLSSYSASAPNYLRYGYPASYNHVISVSSVNYKNYNFSDQITVEPFGTVSWYNEDLISPAGLYENGVYSSYYGGHTTNSRVDICAPGMQAPMYGSYLSNCNDPNGIGLYGNGTSASAPYVTGTVALMQSLNNCLIPDEIEDILQLTSKNLESNVNNHMFIGRIGSGKLETGDSVEFVSEAMNMNGNALIDGQDFWRFNFNLKHVMNKLTISNQILRDNNASDFTAKKAIDILENSDFKPNNNGFVDLKVDSNMILCESSPSGRNSSFEKNKKNDEVLSKSILLYPNPNKGSFRISLNDTSINESTIEIYDIYGKLIFSDKSKNQDIDIELPSIANGIYLIKVKTDKIISNLKFIKK